MQIYKATNHIVSINIPLSLPHMDLWMIGLLFVVVVVVFLFPLGTFSLLPDAREKKNMYKSPSEAVLHLLRAALVVLPGWRR